MPPLRKADRFNADHGQGNEKIDRLIDPHQFRLIFRVDANREIGSGHAMRCIALADAAHRMGVEILFVGSDAATVSYVKRNSPYECSVIKGEWTRLDRPDARSLCELCRLWQADAVLVDSYGAGFGFFEELHARSGQTLVSCIDDQYTLENGPSDDVVRRPVDCVVAYSFYAARQQWEGRYHGASTSLLIGPRFTPLRLEFARGARVRSGEVDRVLIMSGATNPNRSLERMVEGVVGVLERVHIDVVQGQLAEFEPRRLSEAHIEVHRNVSNLSGLMSRADFAVSAGGSTLYELACNGLPALACPIVDNQVRNARAYEEVCKGKSMGGVEWTSAEVTEKIRQFVAPAKLRRCSMISRDVVDGFGASRIIEALISAADAKRGIKKSDRPCR